MCHVTRVARVPIRERRLTPSILHFPLALGPPPLCIHTYPQHLRAPLPPIPSLPPPMATAPKSSASEKPKSSATDKPKSTAEKPKSTTEKSKSATADKPKSKRTTKEKAPKEATAKAKSAGIKKPKTAAAAKKTKVAKPAVDDKAHPSWKDMIKACIVETKERNGVSRTSIKKFITEKFGVDATTPINLSHLNRAITNGAEDGTFALPKGPSGKVKLAPKTKPANENVEPAPAKKAAPAKKTETAKKAPAVKKAPVKTAQASKAASTTKKTSTAKTTERKKTAAKAAASKVIKAKPTASKSKPASKPRAKRAAA
ncbi:hypothetical protein C8Q80DRAFT_1169255 [Daedaleopsis nitida]|nr:hypothetical protein C8Q80DRAFT_1169255 [Daedaleopsis nitida]